MIEQLKQIEERFKSFHQSTKVTSPSTGLKISLQDEDVTSGKKTHIAESEGDEQVSEVAINVLQSTPVKSSTASMRIKLTRENQYKRLIRGYF